MTDFLQLVMLYVFVVIVALVSYALIIPYFVVRRIRRLLASGEMGTMIMNALNSEIVVKDANDEERKITVAQFLVSVAVQNLKMQLNSMKSAIVRSVVAGGEGEDASALDAYLQSVPSKWRWVAQLALPLIAQRMQNAQQAAASVTATTAKFRGL